MSWFEWVFRPGLDTRVYSIGMKLSRRNVMESALAVTTLPGAAEYFINWLHYVAPDAHQAMHVRPPEPPFLDNYQPGFFNREDFAALESICEILIPTDDLPGAKEARCALYIDYVLAAAGEFAPGRQKQWRAAMEDLRKTGFHAAKQEGRERLTKEMSRPEVDRTVHHPAYAAYHLIKSENAFAFYSSRAGLIENLDYKGDSFNVEFPACDHAEHQRV